MLRATKVSMFTNAYEIALDGEPLTRWDGTLWRSGGSFVLQGRHFRVRGNAWGSEFTMTDESGGVVATAGKLGRRQWSLGTGGHSHTFRSPSMWRTQFDLVLGEQAAGYVRRPSIWRSTVEADLPSLPLPVQVFVVGVALTTWDTAAG
jgi:hypothetical protein